MKLYNISRRQPNPPDSGPPGVQSYFFGGLIAGSVVFCVLLCLLYLHVRRSRANKRDAEGSFGIKSVAARPMMAGTNRSSMRTPPPFSRQLLTASIVMPEKSIARKPSQGLSDEAVILPKLGPSPAFSPPSFRRPVQNARSTGQPTLSILNPAHPRHNRASSAFSAYITPPSPPGLNSLPPCFDSVSPSQARPVRQLFKPSLPDELPLVLYGECLMVLQSFNDGWCLVARDKQPSSRSSRLSPGMENSRDSTDVGLVPAWVFVDASRSGVAPTRPFRSTSINALYPDSNPAYARNAIISWANFA